jgi:Tfp pilus assembly protein PilF
MHSQFTFGEKHTMLHYYIKSLMLYAWLLLLCCSSELNAQQFVTQLEDANRPLKSSFSLLDLAKRSYQEQKYQDAFVQIDAVLQINENHCEAYALRAAIQHELREDYLAVNDYNKALEICPNDPIILLDQGQLFFYLNHYDAAMWHFLWMLIWRKPIICVDNVLLP